MGEEEAKKVEGEEAASEPPIEAAEASETAVDVAEAPTEAADASETAKDVTVEKTVIAPQDEKADSDSSKALAFVEKPSEDSKSSGGLADRCAILAQVETEKRMSLIKAWEENEKAKAENKAIKKLSAIGSWENTKKASVDVKLMQIEEKLEKKTAKYAEKLKDRVAMIHRETEERRAMIEARKGEDFLKAQEMAAKYRATGHAPSRLFCCF